MFSKNEYKFRENLSIKITRGKIQECKSYFSRMVQKMYMRLYLTHGVIPKLPINQKIKRLYEFFPERETDHPLFMIDSNYREYRNHPETVQWRVITIPVIPRKQEYITLTTEELIQASEGLYLA